MEQMETKRLVLRKPCADDAESIMKIRNSEFVLQYNAIVPYSLEKTAQQLERDKESMLILEKKEDGSVIGAAFILEDDLRYKVNAYTLSYYLAQEESRKGYMSEAISAIIKWIFAHGAEVISARSFSENTASKALLEKLGFVREGCLRKAVRGYRDVLYDDYLYSMIKEEHTGRYENV